MSEFERIIFLILTFVIAFGVLFYWFRFAYDGAVVAYNKGHSRLGWFVLCVMFPLLLFVIYILPPTRTIPGKTKEWPLRIPILLFPIVVIFWLYVLKRYNFHFYISLIREDSLVEYLTAAVYFISSIIAAIISISFFKQRRLFLGISYIFLACGMFWISGEEISWGQRILNVSSPSFFLEHNYQKETNLHNLELLGGTEGILHKVDFIVGLYGAFLWIALVKIKKDKLLLSPYFIPNWYLMSYFLTFLLFHAYGDYIKPYNNILGLIGLDQEPVELILSLGFFMFILINRSRQKNEFNMPADGKTPNQNTQRSYYRYA